MKAGKARRLVRAGAPLPARIRPSFVANPVFVYALVWVSALGLVASRLLVFMSEVTQPFVLMVAGNIAVAAVAYAIARFLTSWRRRQLTAGTITAEARVALRRFCDWLFIAWSVGSLVNMAASGGLPIAWQLLGNRYRSYADYGIPTFTGLIAACGFFAASGYLLLHLQGRTRSRWWAIALIFLYQIAIMSRGGVVWLLLQLGAVYLQVGRMRMRRAVFMALFAFGVVILFGWMGDIRTFGYSTELMRNTTTPEGEELFRKMPYGFWWTYLYASVGAVNLNAAMEGHEPLGYPRWSLSNLLPTVIRARILTETDYSARYPLPMVSDSFNVFTMYGGYFADFGILGCLAVTFILQLIAGHYFVRARRGDAGSVIAYAVCVQVILMSLFTDTLTSWVTLFQFVLTLIFRAYERRLGQMARRPPLLPVPRAARSIRPSVRRREDEWLLSWRIHKAWWNPLTSVRIRASGPSPMYSRER